MKFKKCDMINKNKLTLLIPFLSIFIAVIFSGCWGGSTNDSGLVVVNVLDKKYYEDCHIQGSVHIPFEDIEARIKTFDKNNHYVFYCSNYACTAAPFTATMLKEAGFPKVSVYHGGIVEWYQKKYPCVGPAELSYLKDENEHFSYH